MHEYSDPEVETLLRSVSLSNGFNAWLGFRLIAAGSGRVELDLETRADMLQHHGFVHGGVVGALADTACSWAAASASGDVVTATYTIHFLAPARPPRLRARAAVLKASRRNATVKAEIFAETEGGTDTLIAVATAAIAVLQRTASS